jgi:separase
VERNQRNSIIAKASFVHSLLALDRGVSHAALTHAKRSVRLLHRAWANVEHMVKKAKSTSPASSAAMIEQLTTNVSQMSVSDDTTMQNSAPDTVVGPLFWPLVSQLFRSLIHLSTMYAHHGMFQETIYYAEQAQKFATNVNADAYNLEALTLTGSTWLKAGTSDKAAEFLMQAKAIESPSPNLHSVMLQSHFASLYSQDDDDAAELTAYQSAEATLEKLTDASFIDNLENFNGSPSLEAQMSQLALSKPKTTRKAPATRKTTTRAKTPAERRGTTRSKASAPSTSATTLERGLLTSIKSKVLRQKAQSLLLKQSIEEASSIINEAKMNSHGHIDEISQHTSTALQLLQQSIAQMTADPVYSVLQESTISFPSVIVSKTEKSTADRSTNIRLSPPKKTTVRGRARSPTCSGFFEMLRQAQEHLSEAQSLAIHKAPTAVIHSISSLMSSVVVLLSAAGCTVGKIALHPGYASCSIEMARNEAVRRERKAVLGDEKTSREEDLCWPMTGSRDSRRASIHGATDINRFQKDYIDIIPSTWTAISIALSENKQELCLTRLQAGQSPFVLRLPLGRNNSRDADEEIFDFQQGHAELLEIIDLANYSAHDAKNLTGKGAKTAWWEERTALDVRLKELLENIEKVWLGGFKGIFSQHTRRSDLLARFQQSFNNILEKHLPSRQKTGKKAKSTKVALDTRILELFIGLGDASAEDADFDEPLTDLLYFVVDILQFHGERNAYDEIDFDSLVVETHDALRCYHEAVHSHSSSAAPQHTILILDKALHAFPWESLPCMANDAVSRLPSLASLRDRILAMQTESTSNAEDAEAHYISRSSGASILNPSGDLSSTSQTFTPLLHSLPDTWTHTQSRAPTEEEFANHLSTRDLLLYFGHGSGAQYIRSRTIKRLDKCAVAILMGCSSVAVTTAGEFESWGTALGYLGAGAKAVVGTLWDVTDRDVDRFAGGMLGDWGLWDGNDNRGRGKGKSSLVEAVRKGRGMCKFRYLTAASLVVYGVPVYLK